jgi:hypothetical protein
MATYHMCFDPQLVEFTFIALPGLGGVVGHKENSLF